jgi:hypothetical protein
MPGRDEDDRFLREWLVHFGKRQASLVKELGRDKARASFVWNGRQPYRRALVNEVARWLGIRLFELLMPPREALAMRRLRDTALAIAAEEEGVEFDHSDPEEPSAGDGRARG